MPLPTLIHILPILIVTLNGLTLHAADSDPLEVLTRRPHEVRDAIRSSDDAIAMAILRGIPAAGREELLALTVEHLDSQRPKVVEAALNALERSPLPFLAQNLGEIRALLRHENERIRWLSARLAGEFKDDLAVDGLIPLLKDTPKVAEAAHWALTEVFVADVGTDPQRWVDHYERWLETEEVGIPNLVDQLDATDDPKEQVKLLHRLILMKTHRHTVGDILAEYRTSEDPSVSQLASAGVRNLGGVALIKNGPAPGSTTDINALLSNPVESSSNRSPEPSTPHLATQTDKPAGLSIGQIVTAMVIVMIAGAGVFYVRKLATQKSSNHKGPPPPGGSGSGQSGNKPRITFSS